MEPTAILLIATTVLAVWFASALLMVYLVARDSYVDHGHIAWAAVFGPVSFLMILCWFLQEQAEKLLRLIRRGVAKVRAWMAS